MRGGGRESEDVLYSLVGPFTCIRSGVKNGGGLKNEFEKLLDGM